MPDPCFDEFLDDFVDGDRDEFLLCLIRALKKDLSRMEQYHPDIKGGLFISTGVRKERVSRNTISFWLQSVISFACSSASEEDCCALRVRAYEVKKVATSLLGPSGSEGRDIVWPVDFLLLLPERCHTQALGCILHWACGGGSAGCLAL